MDRQKKCNCCGQVKPISSFQVRNRAKGYVQPYCKVCFNEKRKGRRLRTLEHSKQIAAAYHEKHGAKLNAGRRERYKILAAARAAENQYRIALVSIKKCRGCGLVKLSAAFYHNPRTSDGLSAQCRECMKSHSMDWIRRNKDRASAIRHLRRARAKQAGGFHTAADLVALRESQKFRCAACSVPLGANAELDHIEPLSRGGSNWPSNLQWLCQFCNRSKHTRPFSEFMRSRGITQ